MDVRFESSWVSSESDPGLELGDTDSNGCDAL